MEASWPCEAASDHIESREKELKIISFVSDWLALPWLWMNCVTNCWFFLSCSADAWSVVVGRRCQISPCARLPPSHYAGWNALGRGYLLHPAFGGELFPAAGRRHGPFACCGHLLRAAGSFTLLKQLGAGCVWCRQRGRCTFEQTLSEIIWGMQVQLLQTPSLEFFPTACISVAFYQNVSSFSCRSKELACKLS